MWKKIMGKICNVYQRKVLIWKMMEIIIPTDSAKGFLINLKGEILL
jgi:hypothetical protein